MAESMEPVRKSVAVARGVDEAFKLFTEGIGSWWPLEKYSIGEERVRDVIFEPRMGGKIIEIWDDGSEHSWADILEYDPPNRFVLAWQPNPGRPAPTELEVRFIAEGSGTRVELDHRGWERLGHEAKESRAGYDGGWVLTLQRYVDAAA